MKAIVVRQPWASLIAHGIKTIETRPFQPRTTLRPGDRLAIVAGKAEPKHAPDPIDESDDGSGWWLGDFVRVCDERPTGEGWWLERWEGTEADLTVPLPLGAVVAVVTYDTALRMIPTEPYVGPLSQRMEDKDRRREWLGRWTPDLDYIGIGGLDGGPWLVEGKGENAQVAPLAAEAALGDFQVGRYGWLLSNPQRIDPVPVVGKQGVFTLPDDVTAQLTADHGA